MIRILVWRFLYHFFCFCKILGFRGRRVRYFAYGANLDPKVLARRNISTYSKTQYTLEGYTLRFNHEIPFKNAAMASIEPSENNKVPGIIYEIDKIDEKRLDCMESHIIFNRYGKEYSNDNKNNSFFFYRTNCPKENLFPTTVYLNKIISGYKLLAPNPIEFMENLSKTKTIEGFEAKDPPDFLLVCYDKRCVKLFAKLIFKPSIFEKHK